MCFRLVSLTVVILLTTSLLSFSSRPSCTALRINCGFEKRKKKSQPRRGGTVDASDSELKDKTEEAWPPYRRCSSLLTVNLARAEKKKKKQQQHVGWHRRPELALCSESSSFSFPTLPPPSPSPSPSTFPHVTSRPGREDAGVEEKLLKFPGFVCENS